MKLHILSDLHLEFGPFDMPVVDADVLILAGDINLGAAGINEYAGLARRKRILYVAGNHEYYRHTYPGLNELLYDVSLESGIAFMENRAVEIDGVRFVGCTLWTDFEVLGAAQKDIAALFAGQGMSDYQLILRSHSGGRLRPEDTIAAHHTSVAFLRETLAQRFDGPTVVITHHAPSPRSVPAKFESDMLNCAFVSNLEPLIEEMGPALWIHGHTHHCVDYLVGKTRVLSNQRGYPREDTGGFKADLVVEV